MQRKPIEKVLIANRGEIALRILRTAKELGKKVVTVYSPEDRGGLWRFLGDESYEISNYLNLEEVIDVAKKSKADAIHPGYGFLSEREDFAKACEDVGVIFIGPPPSAMYMSGDKVVARRKAQEAGVPIVPGSEAIDDPKEALKIAKSIGFPVLLKAAGGGGGKGMRPVYHEDDFLELFRQASEEAKAAFGDPRIYLEKYIQEPKHIEVQVIADQYGNYLYLFERDCSLQRRNQKVIEESPAPHLPHPVRLKICESAVKIMRQIGYVNAGTVEFIVDKDWNFYFIEINARIQVEHPVTELVTGIDIVKWQIKIAEGEKLNISQEDIKINGHAMELRIYAEDPFGNFMPSGGFVSLYKEPNIPGVRCDGWLYSGCFVPSKYDPMLLKLIAKAETRDETINRLLVALDELRIQGIKSNVPFFKFVLNHPVFRKGEINTWSMGPILEEFNKKLLEDSKLKRHLLALGAYIAGKIPVIETYVSYDGLLAQEVRSNGKSAGAGVWRKIGWKFAGRSQPRLR